MNVGEVQVKMNDNGTALVQWCDSRGTHSKILQPGDTFSANFGIKNQNISESTIESLAMKIRQEHLRDPNE